MVWIRIGGGRRRGWGSGGRGGYGRGYGGGYGRGYGGGYGRGSGGGGGCLRDLLLLDAGCCLAEALGCGPQLVLLAPAAVHLVLHRAPAGRSRSVALVQAYQTRVSAGRARGCCRMTPSCSAYAVEALHAHGTARGWWLTARRLLRCRPGGPTGPDPVPPARRAG